MPPINYEIIRRAWNELEQAGRRAETQEPVNTRQNQAQASSPSVSTELFSRKGLLIPCLGELSLPGSLRVWRGSQLHHTQTNSFVKLWKLAPSRAGRAVWEARGAGHSQSALRGETLSSGASAGLSQHRAWLPAERVQKPPPLGTPVPNLTAHC